MVALERALSLGAPQLIDDDLSNVVPGRLGPVILKEAERDVIPFYYIILIIGRKKSPHSLINLPPIIVSPVMKGVILRRPQAGK